MKTCLAAVLLFSIVLLAEPTRAQADAEETGRALAMQGDSQGTAPCMTCHGADGAGMADAGFPALSLLQADYMLKQLQDFQSGARASAIMAPTVAQLSAGQMAAVSRYYANLPAPAATQASTPVDSAQLMLGEQLVNEGDWSRYVVPCASCHGPGNRGVGAEFPALAGQHALYLKQQLQAWQSGSRHNDPNQLMLAIAERLTAEEIDAVTLYLSTLPSGAP